VCAPVAVQKQTVSASAWKPFTVCTGFQEDGYSLADLADFWLIVLPPAAVSVQVVSRVCEHCHRVETQLQLIIIIIIIM
jgi:hypothetical protein